MVIENFKERYLSLKAKGKTDEIIAGLLYVGRNTLSRLKKEHDLLGFNNYKYFEISDEQLEKAKSIGLDRYTVRYRVIHHGWDIEKAISTPKVPANARWKYKKSYKRI